MAEATTDAAAGAAAGAAPAASDDAPERSLYVIQCVDDASCGLQEGTPRGGSVKRMENYAAHKAYQASVADPENEQYIRKIAAGPLLSEDGTTMTGSLFLVQATREEAETFCYGDPFHDAGVWESVTIFKYLPMKGITAYPPP